MVTPEAKLEALETARRKAVSVKNEAEKQIIGYSKRIRKIKREIRDAGTKTDEV